MKRTLLVMVLCLGISGIAQGTNVVWIGHGSDSYWSNPDNWEGGVLPTEYDNVTTRYEMGDLPGESILIDGIARANSIIYGDPVEFVNILPSGDLRVKNERVDFHACCGYLQSGGTHIVDTFSMGGSNAVFLMTDGLFKANTLYANPENESFLITGGTVDVDRFIVEIQDSAWPFVLSGTADIHIRQELALNSITSGGIIGAPPMELGVPLHMDGGNFTFTTGDYSRESLDNLNDMNIIFKNTDNISTFEVGGADFGAGQKGFLQNWEIQKLQIGDDIPGFVQLVDLIENNILLSTPEALYVHTLVIKNGSTLDLNGLNLYYRSMINEGGTFLNGSPESVPEPATMFLLGSGLLGLLGLRMRFKK